MWPMVNHLPHRARLNPELQLDIVPTYVGGLEYGLQMPLLHPGFQMLEVF